jgi:hypothetical protein
MFFVNKANNAKPISKIQLDKMLKELEKEIFANQQQNFCSHQKPHKVAA